MKKVAILQSNYIPWKGFFDLIAYVDEFILYDDMQYTRRDWRNRNQIKTPQGVKWLSVPVKVKGKFTQRICETEIDGDKWAINHWRNIESNYRKSKFYNEVAEVFRPIFDNCEHKYLSTLNKELIDAVCVYLGIKTSLKSSTEFDLAPGKTERLADLCKQVGASEYVSGPAAKNYLEERVFDNFGIAVKWFEYDGYQEYPQLWGDFVHGVTILDLLFNCGADSPNYMKYVKQ